MFQTGALIWKGVSNVSILNVDIQSPIFLAVIPGSVPLNPQGTDANLSSQFSPQQVEISHLGNKKYFTMIQQHLNMVIKKKNSKNKGKNVT